MRTVLGQINLPLDQSGWGRLIALLHSLFGKIDREFSRAAYTGEVVWNPGTVNSGASATTTVVVPDIRVNAHYAVRVFPPYSLGALVQSANVSADNQVRIVINNLSGSAVSLGSGTWKVAAEQFPA